MSDAGKSQEPSMEEILASIRRIIAEDEAGRARGTAPAAHPAEPQSWAPRPSARGPEVQPSLRPAPAAPDEGDMVLDLTNMVAADGSVVTIAPTFPPAGSGTRSQLALPAPSPTDFGQPAAPDQGAMAFGAPPRRAPPPGPGAEPSPSFAPPMIPPAPPAAGNGFVGADANSLAPGGRAPAQPPTVPITEDSPSRRVFKRRHAAGTAFAELAQGPFGQPATDASAGFGKVPVGAVTTEVEAPPPSARTSPTFGNPDPFAAPSGIAPSPPATGLGVVPEDQLRTAIERTAEPLVRAWLDAHLAGMVEERLAAMVQAKIDEAVATRLPQIVDQQIRQNVEANLGPYIEDRVGAHVDARLGATVEEKVQAVAREQVAEAVSQNMGQAISQQVAQAVRQQLQAQQQNLSRAIEERVRGELRSMFQRLAGN